MPDVRADVVPINDESTKFPPRQDSLTELDVSSTLLNIVDRQIVSHFCKLIQNCCSFRASICFPFLFPLFIQHKHQIEEDLKTAIALSGGSTRAMVAAIGALRGMEHLSLISHVDLMVSVSGGTWTAGPYMRLGLKCPLCFLGMIWHDQMSNAFDGLFATVNLSSVRGKPLCGELCLAFVERPGSYTYRWQVLAHERRISFGSNYRAIAAFLAGPRLGFVYDK